MSEHVHVWRALEVTDQQEEQIHWCVSCDASKDSSGNVIT